MKTPKIWAILKSKKIKASFQAFKIDGTDRIEPLKHQIQTMQTGNRVFTRGKMPFCKDFLGRKKGAKLFAQIKTVNIPVLY